MPSKYFIILMCVITLSSMAWANDDPITPDLANLLDQEADGANRPAPPLAGGTDDPTDRILAEAALRFASFSGSSEEHRVELQEKVQAAIQVIREYIANHPPPSARPQAPTRSNDGKEVAEIEASVNPPVLAVVGAEPTGSAASDAIASRGLQEVAWTDVGVFAPSPLVPYAWDDVARIGHSERLRSIGEELIDLSEKLSAVQVRLSPEPNVDPGACADGPR